jgi:KDO2-lipid IV(A) lauroyltransferase
VAPHLGGWDFGGAWLASLGYRITTVVEVLEPRELLEFFVSLREAKGLEVVVRGPEAIATLTTALGENRIVALLCDRDLGRRGVDVEFFGERTTLPAGPARLALDTAAPLLAAAVYFRPRGRHYGVVRPPVSVELTGDHRYDVARLTQAIARELEELIRAAPEQWHLMQPNWPSDYPDVLRHPTAVRETSVMHP